jgi:chorismate mutase/prephenate dehydratase
MAKKKQSSRKSTSRTSRSVLRRQIDQLDRQIVAQANERAELARQWAAMASGTQPASPPPTLPPELIDEAATPKDIRNPGPLSDTCVQAVLRELASGTRALVTTTRVAFLGPEYTYSHLAALHRFGHSVELVPVGSIAAVFEEVHSRQADFGLVPVENSTDGRVADTLDMFAKLSVKICGEVPLRIHHNLLGRGPRSAIQTVYSKPQALSQCRNWIAKHLPAATTSEVASTADAARMAQQNPAVAAIASAEAGVQYALEVLAANIEDNPGNLTRFAVISGADASSTGDDKTALMLELEHRPGALADAMAIFKRNRLNMTWIESFPIPGHAGRYLFFVECEGHRADLRVRRALSSLEKKATRLEILGSYARSEPIG